jgi:hypothetical protein
MKPQVSRVTGNAGNSATTSLYGNVGNYGISINADISGNNSIYGITGIHQVSTS